MKRISIALSSFRDALISPCFPSRRSVASQATRRLDVDTQIALAETVQDDIDGIAEELQRIKEQLDQATAALKEACTKEAYLGERSINYRKIVDERACSLRSEREHLMKLEAMKDQGVAKTTEVDLESDEKQILVPDAENNISESSISDSDLRSQREDWEKRMEAWEKDNNALESIHQTQLTILTKCELIRRDIFELEKRKNALLLQSNQCQKFVSQAKASDDLDVERGIQETELVSIPQTIIPDEVGLPETPIDVIVREEEAGLAETPNNIIVREDVE